MSTSDELCPLCDGNGKMGYSGPQCPLCRGSGRALSDMANAWKNLSPDQQRAFKDSIMGTAAESDEDRWRRESATQQQETMTNVAFGCLGVVWLVVGLTVGYYMKWSESWQWFFFGALFLGFIGWRVCMGEGLGEALLRTIGGCFGCSTMVVIIVVVGMMAIGGGERTTSVDLRTPRLTRAETIAFAGPAQAR